MEPSEAWLALVPDDAWYYVEIGQRLADGEGSTFDGLHATNGYHPLWMVMSMCAATLTHSSRTAASLLLGWGVALSLAGFWLVGRVSSKPRQVALFGGSVLVGFYGLKVFANGLESGLAFFLVCLVLWLVQQSPIRPWALGLAVGLAITSRWTSLLLLSPLVIATLASSLRGQALRLLAGVALPIGAALIFGLAMTGHVIPVSGAIKASGGRPLPTALAAIGLLATVLLARKRSSTPEARSRWMIAIGTVAIAAADVAFRDVLVGEIWTLWPYVLVATLFVGDFPRWRAAIAIVAALGIGILSWCIRLQPESWTSYSAAIRTGIWLESNTPAKAIAAGWDVGFISAQTNRRIVNLDGLVNSWEFKEQIIDRHRLNEYLEDELRPGYIAQEVPVDVLRNDPLVTFNTVRLGKWYVKRAECYWFRPATRPWIRQQRVALVLARVSETDDDRTLAEQRLLLCVDSGS